MKKNTLIIYSIALFAPFAFAASSVHAAPITINFDALSLSGVSSYTESGVTFTAPSFSTLESPNGTFALLEESSPRNFLRADISGGAVSVSVDLGDFDFDSDLLFLEVFDSSDTSLGRTEFFIEASFTGMETLSLSTPGISYAIFGGIGENGSSVYADNFTITAIPEPETYAMLLAGLGLLGFTARRRKQNV
ncbi:MAG: FxDxF family PEP-CTERM protein [Nitrosomonas sp.]|uniref:FxDxF family PEP-CTERM protein n=1 Tax=Nitrosomonas sp. TaxID=42353 RepID=UPI002733CC7F|nr:FxDxF family PEP-CTERM protein [Nitrosomonas sp.]MDP3664779.1 FxDxF family PEP-CTERM protein [Nitrosomonas sp.]MDZ4106625.1 FxDxF family PEP-CTERM protein [Nitrosomonas sp.]